MKPTLTFMLASLCCFIYASSSQKVQRNAECQIMRRYFQIMGNDKSNKKRWDERIEADLSCPAECSLIIEPDNYISCVECAYISKKENCPYYDKLAIVENRPVVEEDPMRALHTLPYGLFVTKSSIPGAGLGVFTSIDIPAMVRFGPYDGSIHYDEFIDDDAAKYSWMIYDEEDETAIFVNALNVSHSNWLRYANSPQCQKDENMFGLDYNRQVYYVTLKRIPAGSELFVWYGNNYAFSLGLHQYECNKHMLD